MLFAGGGLTGCSDVAPLRLPVSSLKTACPLLLEEATGNKLKYLSGKEILCRAVAAFNENQL